MISQGDIFWIDLGKPTGSGPGFRHPHVVVQSNIFNRSRISTVVVCSVTSNGSRSAAPGNVLLGIGEANLEKPSVVNISQIFTVDKSRLGKKIGTLSTARMQSVLEGLVLLLPRDVEQRLN